jgi:hypothetical protein
VAVDEGPQSQFVGVDDSAPQERWSAMVIHGRDGREGHNYDFGANDFCLALKSRIGLNLQAGVLSLVLLLSPSLRQSSELFRKVMGFFHALPLPLEVAQESALQLELQNGSRIVSLPGSESTVRGYSACSLLIIDEASRCSDELIAAATPALATTDGRLVALSTPWGRRGWFYNQWAWGEGWHKTLLRSTDCPRIKPEFLAEERKQLGEFMYSQEYLCEFLDNETSVFSSELVEAALDEGVAPLWT